MPNDALHPAWLICLGIGAAALLAAALIRLSLPLLQRYALARPNARSSHSIPTPQGAGIAVVAAALGVAGTLIALQAPTALATLAPVFAAALLLAATGAIDDIAPLSVTPRLIAQAVAVAAMVWALPDDLRIAPFLPAWLERAGLLLGTLWFVNLVNFMDGLDWITVAEVVPVSGALVALGLLGTLPWPDAVLAAALGGACLGFAPFNKPVARVFLGDVGSLPIGLLLAWCLIGLAAQSWAAALLLPLYYLMDATLTLLRRLWRREAVWQSHRCHFYQQATSNGFTVMQVVTQLLVLNLALAALAIGAALSRSWVVEAALLALGVAAVALLLRRFSRPRR
ncbi:UDP-N-acetylmuramyl pentapeptide phosphotransferase/UDP-N-acetylglucosamine-1-phosphate transferase [Rhodopseudomonas rhenobacensis]|uniref:UDP-N-acetylmuramyl pentapeptide phosphotransferase/UDP-N-acetylglucosamine-1-phosphate transferase n=1 Tax=Rhodopseudomonas rhenobacensis TaxID=87461 RepID=A0A7W7Z2Z9_9BRAD|nr:glycosyl transferase [Rhodopseudomonas rhenobacensis]MBB5047047.1 UDP-N-acetylmuramyl pentapeptide phosphotransferase/UDP-N-acetylglucosamine-1-phosphate transferase [Rhodopseudomonas rhenobacensis]